MKIRLLKPYQMSSVGDVLDPAKPVALLLIERGVATLFVEDAPTQIEELPVSTPADLPKPSEIKQGGGVASRLRQKLRHRGR